jgi:hypothetical protein
MLFLRMAMFMYPIVTGDPGPDGDDGLLLADTSSFLLLADGTSFLLLAS